MTTEEIKALMGELGINSQTGREEAPSDPRSTNSLYKEFNGDGLVSLILLINTKCAKILE